MFRQTLPLITLLFAFAEACAEAEAGEIGQLRTQLELLKQQVASLESSVARLESEQTGQPAGQGKELASAEPEPAATDEGRVRINADFRYRHDWIDIESEGGLTDNRDRARIRARGELVAKLSDAIDIGFGVASGDEDPLSTNQTLGQQASSKDWRLDLAYFDWEVFEGLSWIGGKYKNPEFRPGSYPLLWDDDLRPEGMSLVYDSGRIFGSFGFNFIDSDTRGPLGDRYGYRNFQLGYRMTLGAETELSLGASYIDFDTEGRPTLIPGLTFNNTTNPDGSLAYDYDELEYFAELRTRVAGRPLLVFADYVRNVEIDEQNIGYAYGFEYGSTSETGGWKLRSAYQKLEADAVYGAFTDSDFAGGGTDNKGYSVSFGYAINPRTQIRLTYFDTERAVRQSIENLSFDRGFLDLLFRY